LIEQIEPFHRVSESERPPRWAGWTLRAMRAHFTAAGTVLLVGALAILAYLFALEFERVTMTRGLRITRPGSIYEQKIQLQMAGAVLLALASVLQLRVAGVLGGRRRGAPAAARLAATLLLLSLPAGMFAWWQADRATGSGVTAQLLSDVSLGVRVVAVALVVQGLFHFFPHHQFRQFLTIGLGDDGDFVGLVFLKLGHRFVFDGAAAVVFFHALPGEDPGVDDHAFDPGWHPQGSVFHVPGFFPEDGPEQLLLRGELGLAFGGDFSHQDVAGAHFRAHPDDAAVVQIAQGFFTHVKIGRASCRERV